MHLAFLFEFDPNSADRTGWPAAKLGHWGRCVAMATALEQAGHRVTRIGGLDKTGERRSRRAKLLRRVYGWQRYLPCLPNRRRTPDPHHHYLAWAEPRFNREYGHQIASQLRSQYRGETSTACGNDYDAIVTPDANLVAYLDTDRPIFFWADTTYATLIDQYPGFRGLCGRSRRQLHKLDRMALNRCRRIFLASEWAIAGAIAAYGLQRDRFRLIELGGNFEPTNPLTISATIAARNPKRLNLLFVGTDWQRKGGDRAIALLEQLQQQEIPAQLTIIGGQPPTQPQTRGIIHSLGQLDPTQACDRAQLESAFRSAHFLVLPSEAECFGHVLCEANAFGVPVLTSDVGGIPSVVRAGVNGYMAPLTDWVTAIGEVVVALWRDPASYQVLARSARQEYETRLNWTSLGDQVSAEISKSLVI